ncbi:MAG TPA: ABC transporter ATP-binding protein [Acidimicrobiia bacterium]|nr:ABC transporter ATP-binding protein [Acidimicrobiia bacterium]
MRTPVLEVRDLTTVLNLAGGPVEVVRGVSLDVGAGETVGLVGESGCGKTMAMLSVMGLHPQPPAEILTGEVIVGGRDIRKLSEEERRMVRGAQVAMVYQDPMTSLNPLMRIGDQIREVLVAHGKGPDEARNRTVEILGQVGIPQPRRAAESYPHEYSGGMRQRAMIAMALALHPKVLIADEPTTALDVTIQQQIITLVADLQQAMGMAVIWVTHDLGVVARVAERILVMYGGHIVERGPTDKVFRDPEHPYTAGLLESIPRVRGAERHPLRQIPGAPPDPTHQPTGCPFHPRCPNAVEKCVSEMPPLTERGGADDAEHWAACWVPPEEWVA